MANHPKRGGRRAPCVNPTVAEVRKAQDKAGLTNKAAADLVCVTEHTWENWVTEGPNHRDMPAGAWKLFRYEIGWLEPPRPGRPIVHPFGKPIKQ